MSLGDTNNMYAVHIILCSLASFLLATSSILSPALSVNTLPWSGSCGSIPEPILWTLDVRSEYTLGETRSITGHHAITPRGILSSPVHVQACFCKVGEPEIWAHTWALVRTQPHEVKFMTRWLSSFVLRKGCVLGVLAVVCLEFAFSMVALKVQTEEEQKDEAMS